MKSTKNEGARKAHLKIVLENDFNRFLRYFFKKIKGHKFLHKDFHEKITVGLEEIHAGGIPVFVVNIPPQYGKTEIMKYFVAWCYAKNPKCDFIYTSFNEKLVLECSDGIKTIIKSEEFQEFWPLKINKSKDSKTIWEIIGGGKFNATQMGGSATGFGAGSISEEGFYGALIIDDPLKPTDAMYPKLREKSIGYYEQTLDSRVRKSGITPIILIMQRLHETDLAGYFVKKIPKTKLLKIPVFDAKGRAIFPEKDSKKSLLEKQERNKYVFAGQYMQTPTPADGGIFKEEWFNCYEELPSNLIRIVQSWDTAFKDKETSDYSVCTTWGVAKNKNNIEEYYLIDVVRKKLTFGKLLKEFARLDQQFNPSLIYIEDKASGQSLSQVLKDANYNKVKLINPDSDKVSRANACSFLFETGRVYLPRSANWLTDYITELITFPNADHDDQVDSTTQFLNQQIVPVKQIELFGSF